jgi:hypothetical protein
MAQSVLVELELPNDWRKFWLPPALQERLQELLDRQNRTGKLSRKERREAMALAELVDLLSLMRDYEPNWRPTTTVMSEHIPTPFS